MQSKQLSVLVTPAHTSGKIVLIAFPLFSWRCPMKVMIVNTIIAIMVWGVELPLQDVSVRRYTVDDDDDPPVYIVTWSAYNVLYV